MGGGQAVNGLSLSRGKLCRFPCFCVLGGGPAPAGSFVPWFGGQLGWLPCVLDGGPARLVCLCLASFVPWMGGRCGSPVPWMCLAWGQLGWFPAVWGAGSAGSSVPWILCPLDGGPLWLSCAFLKRQKLPSCWGWLALEGCWGWLLFSKAAET